MDTRLRVAHRERVPEQGRALALVQALLGGNAEQVTLRAGLRDSRLRKGQHEHVLGQDALLLHARRREVHELAVRQLELGGWQTAVAEDSPLAHRDTAAGTRDPAELVELAAQLGDQVRGLASAESHTANLRAPGPGSGRAPRPRH